MPPWNRQHFKLKQRLIWRFRLKAAWHRWISLHAPTGIEVRPFIVTGPPRSGTSLLTALLSRKPNVIVANEPVVVSELTLVEWNPARLLEGYINHTASRAAKAGVMRTKVDPDSPGKPTTDTWNVGSARDEVSIEIDRTKPLAVGVKHPHAYMDFLEELCTGWPELKVICSIRNPGPTIRSWRETGFGWDPQIDDPTRGLWHRYYDLIPNDCADPLAKRAHVWRILVDRAHEFATNHPEQVMIARYEDLVENPAEVTKRMFRHINAANPDDPIDVSDVKKQERPQYRGFEDEEAAMIEAICESANERARST